MMIDMNYIAMAYGGVMLTLLVVTPMFTQAFATYFDNAVSLQRCLKKDVKKAYRKKSLLPRWVFIGAFLGIFVAIFVVDNDYAPLVLVCAVMSVHLFVKDLMARARAFFVKLNWAIGMERRTQVVYGEISQIKAHEEKGTEGKLLLSIRDANGADIELFLAKQIRAEYGLNGLTVGALVTIFYRKANKDGTPHDIEYMVSHP